MLPAHLDPKIPLDVPEAVKDRLRRNEQAQRYRVNAKNKELIKANNKITHRAQIDLLPVEKVDIIALAEEENWTCACHRVPGHEGCFQRVDITKKGLEHGAPVIGHIIATGLAGGHTKENLGLMRAECNKEVADKIENTAVSKTERLRKKTFGIDRKGDPAKKRKWQKKIASRKDGLQSNTRWPKRKMRSRSSFN